MGCEEFSRTKRTGFGLCISWAGHDGVFLLVTRDCYPSVGVYAMPEDLSGYEAALGTIVALHSTIHEVAGQVLTFT